ncbi:MAG: hypothetical protein HY774_03055 [Acidobacteria bacterium]|nr:hypothetical protein [Acidobacteriota bacterium]
MNDPLVFYVAFAGLGSRPDRDRGLSHPGYPMPSLRDSDPYPGAYDPEP